MSEPEQPLARVEIEAHTDPRTGAQDPWRWRAVLWWGTRQVITRGPWEVQARARERGFELLSEAQPEPDIRRRGEVPLWLQV